MNTVTYTQGSDLPDLAINWLDRDKAIIDYSLGYGFQLKVGYAGQTALFTKTGGITGASVLPNVVVAWSVSSELNTLAPGEYDAQLKAIRTVDNRERILSFTLRVLPAIL
jgi:hypothetical protein